jgi:sulfite exporter TauE/SafE
VTELLPVLATALAAGFVGSAHCLGMCAGISGLYAMHSTAASLRAEWPRAVVYNGGRVVSYAVLGAIVGGFGSVLAASIPRLAGPLRFATGTVIVLVGLQVAFDLRWLRPVERMGGALWQRLAPAARRFLPVDTAPRAFGLGLLWGWLPCGLVYSVLLIAATSGGAANGAITMLAFGIGTLPAMLATGLGAARLAAMTRRRGARLGFGLLIVALGLATLAMPLRKLL